MAVVPSGRDTLPRRSVTSAEIAPRLSPDGVNETCAVLSPFSLVIDTGTSTSSIFAMLESATSPVAVGIEMALTFSTVSGTSLCSTYIGVSVFSMFSLPILLGRSWDATIPLTAISVSPFSAAATLSTVT